jgi:hypothetical protein
LELSKNNNNLKLDGGKVPDNMSKNDRISLVNKITANKILLVKIEEGKTTPVR